MVTVALAVGIALGFLAGWLPRREELAYLRKELAIAQDRLLHAWRDDKALIPPRPAEEKPIEKLPTELQELVDEWESPETRAAIEQRLRADFFERGRGVAAILKDQENQHP